MIEPKGAIPALTTRLAGDRSLDLDGFGRPVETVVADRVHRILASGCAGEAWALDNENLARFAAAVPPAAARLPAQPGMRAAE